MVKPCHFQLRKILFNTLEIIMILIIFIFIFFPQTNETILTDLSRDHVYEIVVAAFNSEGVGPLSRPITVYVGEAVPTGQPLRVNATPVSPTEIKLTWVPPQSSSQNGDLLGYKVYIVL